MKIAISTLVHPRIEFPFFKEWANYLKNINIDKIFLGLDINNIDVIWDKKNNEKYYHLDKNKYKILNIWKNICKDVDIEVEIINFKSDTICVAEKQCEFHKLINEKVSNQGFDYCSFIDIDEFFIIKNDNIKDFIKFYDLIFVRQILFDSRWDYQNNFEPRLCKEIKNYNPKVIRLTKCIYNVKKYKNMKSVHIFNADGICLKAKPEDLVIHHFRGKETGCCDAINNINDFPKTTNNSFKHIYELCQIKLI